MNVYGNYNVVAGRDINLCSNVQNDEYDGIPEFYREELNLVLEQIKRSTEPKSVVARYIQRISGSAPAEVISAIIKLIGKFI